MLKEGNTAVLDLLRNASALLHVASITHRCPIDWRTKKPIIVRETMQWFADVSRLRSQAAAALKEVNVILFCVSNFVLCVCKFIMRMVLAYACVCILCMCLSADDS